MPSMLKKNPSLLAGKTSSIPAYYEGQNANGVPDHYVSRDEAQKLKSSGSAKSIHRGQAILIKGRRRSRDSVRESVKGGWKVVGQTQKNPLRPGMPRYNSVR